MSITDLQTVNTTTELMRPSAHTASRTAGRKRKPSAKAAAAAQIPFLRGEDQPRPSAQAVQPKNAAPFKAPAPVKRSIQAVYRDEDSDEYDELSERKRIMARISNYKTLIQPAAPQLIKEKKLPAPTQAKATRKKPAAIETTAIAATQTFISSPEFIESPEDFVAVSDEFLHSEDIFMQSPDDCLHQQSPLQETMDDLFQIETHPIEEELAAAIMELPPAVEEAPQTKRAKITHQPSAALARPYSLQAPMPAPKPAPTVSSSLLQPKRFTFQRIGEAPSRVFQPGARSLPVARAVHGGNRLQAHVGFAANLQALLGAQIAAK